MQTYAEIIAARALVVTPAQRDFLEALANLQEIHGFHVSPERPEEVHITTAAPPHHSLELPGYLPGEIRDFLAAYDRRDATVLGGDRARDLVLCFGVDADGTTHHRGPSGAGVCGAAEFDSTANLGEVDCADCLALLAALNPHNRP